MLSWMSCNGEWRSEVNWARSRIGLRPRSPCEVRHPWVAVALLAWRCRGERDFDALLPAGAPGSRCGGPTQCSPACGYGPWSPPRPTSLMRTGDDMRRLPGPPRNDGPESGRLLPIGPVVMRAPSASALTGKVRRGGCEVGSGGVEMVTGPIPSGLKSVPHTRRRRSTPIGRLVDTPQFDTRPGQWKSDTLRPHSSDTHPGVEHIV